MDSSGTVSQLESSDTESSDTFIVRWVIVFIVSNPQNAVRTVINTKFFKLSYSTGSRIVVPLFITKINVKLSSLCVQKSLLLTSDVRK